MEKQLSKKRSGHNLITICLLLTKATNELDKNYKDLVCKPGELIELILWTPLIVLVISCTLSTSCANLIHL